MEVGSASLVILEVTYGTERARGSEDARNPAEGTPFQAARLSAREARAVYAASGPMAGRTKRCLYLPASASVGDCPILLCVSSEEYVDDN